MAKKHVRDDSEAMERAAAERRKAHYVLRLYVAGMTSKSAEAIRNVTEICEKHLHGRYDLEVVDIYRNPDALKADQVIAAPTLIRKLPLPLRKMIGTMTDKDKVIVGLDLRKQRDSAGK